MRINNVSRAALEAALERTNQIFAGNIRFKDILAENLEKTSWRLTLTVHSSDGPGARRSPSGRKVAAACWHAYGTFFDSLPEGAIYYAPSVVGFDRWGREILRPKARKPGAPWEDWLIGGAREAIYYSEACEC